MLAYIESAAPCPIGGMMLSTKDRQRKE